MEEALRAKLLGTAALAALVGRNVEWGLRAPGAGLPGVTLFEVSGVPGMTFTTASGWTRSRVQIGAWGRTYKAARDVADLIGKPGVGVLVGLRDTVGGTRLRTFIIGRRTDSDSDEAGPVFRTALDVLVWHAPA